MDHADFWPSRPRRALDRVEGIEQRRVDRPIPWISFTWKLPVAGKAHAMAPYISEDSPLTTEPELHHSSDVTNPVGGWRLSVGTCTLPATSRGSGLRLL